MSSQSNIVNEIAKLAEGLCNTFVDHMKLWMKCPSDLKSITWNMLSIQFPPADVDQGMTQTSYPGFCDNDRKSLKVPLFERE